MDLYTIFVGAAAVAAVATLLQVLQEAQVRRRTRTWVEAIQRAMVDEALRDDVDRPTWT